MYALLYIVHEIDDPAGPCDYDTEIAVYYDGTPDELYAFDWPKWASMHLAPRMVVHSVTAVNVTEIATAYRKWYR